jgi:hypothetical protein
VGGINLKRPWVEADRKWYLIDIDLKFSSAP